MSNYKEIVRVLNVVRGYLLTIEGSITDQLVIEIDQLIQTIIDMSDELPTKLDPNEIHSELTSREIAAILGGLVGGLSRVAKVEEIRTAFRFWAEQDEIWELV